jgi:hypothetical protein
MAHEKYKGSMVRVAVILALALGVAALGWIAGQNLPLARSPSPSPKSAEPPHQPAIVEATLDEQIAAVGRGAGATIQIGTAPVSRQELLRLSRLATLQVLLLDHRDNAIGDDDCRVLAGLKGLIHLRIRGGTIGDAGLAELARLPQLKILNLPHSQATNDGLSALAAMPRLSQLRLGSPQLSDAGMKELARFPALRQLHLIDAPITDAGLETISRLPRLQSLYLDGSRVTDSGLTELFRTRPHLHVHINQQHHDRDPQKEHE